ncbi:hypothetical protein PAXRUDRAFT_829715 [Paxillus rubicundulus Ve08.2h10]|uniref:Uncharacterized protein n=1 Tax=Paxillus rubicundulus Ve08.2h10 TaxID=930991 RepID=A0A0D0E5E6_9AGAM|nr:hypothetical protein PAXRUDRAFT_829715 [Paxillus rubicundulus Ve08.2h10]
MMRLSNGKYSFATSFPDCPSAARGVKICTPNESWPHSGRRNFTKGCPNLFLVADMYSIVQCASPINAPTLRPTEVAPPRTAWFPSQPVPSAFQGMRSSQPNV